MKFVGLMLSAALARATVTHSASSNEAEKVDVEDGTFWQRFVSEADSLSIATPVPMTASPTKIPLTPPISTTPPTTTSPVTSPPVPVTTPPVPVTTPPVPVTTPPVPVSTPPVPVTIPPVPGTPIPASTEPTSAPIPSTPCDVTVEFLCTLDSDNSPCTDLTPETAGGDCLKAVSYEMCVSNIGLPALTVSLFNFTYAGATTDVLADLSPEDLILNQNETLCQFQPATIDVCQTGDNCANVDVEGTTESTGTICPATAELCVPITVSPLPPVTPPPATGAPVTPPPVTPPPATGAPVTPPPVTPPPVTGAPVTPPPVTPPPVTGAPVTPPPVTGAPVTPAPVTPAPVTPAPVTPAPVTPAPVTPAPVTPAPVTPAPVTPAPITPAPVTPAPVPLTAAPSVPVVPAPCNITADISCTSTGGQPCNSITPITPDTCTTPIEGIRFLFTNCTCGCTENMQGSAASCNFTKPFDGTPVTVNCSDGNSGTAMTVSPSQVTEGTLFTVVNPSGSLPTKLVCSMSQNGVIVQTVSLDAAGDIPLKPLDKFGAMQVVACNDQTCIAALNFTYTIFNIGTDSVNLTKADRIYNGASASFLRALGTSVIAAGGREAVGESRDVNACLSFTSNTQINVEGVSPTNVMCQASDSLSFSVTRGGTTAPVPVNPPASPTFAPSGGKTGGMGYGRKH